MAGKKTTMAAIARAAGVSVPTVSRVLNGRGGISAETRERVERHLRDHDYRVRSTPRPTSTGLIDLVFPDLDCAWESEQLIGIEQVTREAGVGVVVSALRRPGSTPEQVMRQVRAGRTDGAILVATSGAHPLGAALGSLSVPVLALDPDLRIAPDLPTISSTNRAGARALTEHLITLGHRRIALIVGVGNLECAQARLRGFREAMDDAGLRIDPALIEHGDFEFASGFDAAERLLDRADPPTAIFAQNDGMAFGVYRAAHLRGISIPDRLSVAGFDDLPSSRWLSPPLTTVRQPLREMGRMAAETILRMAGGATADALRQETTTHLIVRQSTAPPAS